MTRNFKIGSTVRLNADGKHLFAAAVNRYGINLERTGTIIRFNSKRPDIARVHWTGNKLSNEIKLIHIENVDVTLTPI